MIRFECDTCQRLKEGDETWILGFAAETVGATASRREISLVSQWHDENATDSLAVHFCSERCSREYMGELFSDQAPQAEAGAVTVPRRRVTRTVPGAVVDTRVVRRKKPVAKAAAKGRPGKKKRKA